MTRTTSIHKNINKAFLESRPKRIILLSIYLSVIVLFIGCHKNPIELDKACILNIGLKQGFSNKNKSAIESFDAQVEIYYSRDTSVYLCNFNDSDGDGIYTVSSSSTNHIYARYGEKFIISVSAVIQGDATHGISTEIMLTPDRKRLKVYDIQIVLLSGYTRLVVNANASFDGENISLYGEVLEETESIEEYGFLLKQGEISNEEKKILKKNKISDSERETLLNSGFSEVLAEPIDNSSNIFIGHLSTQELDSAEYLIVAIAKLYTAANDSITKFALSRSVNMTFSGDGVHINEYVYTEQPTYNGDSVILSGHYEGSSEIYQCGFAYGINEYQLTDTAICSEINQDFLMKLFELEPATYYYKAFVKTQNGTTESETGQFTIEQEPELYIYTESASNITTVSATLNGQISYTDGVEYCGFVYGLTTNAYSDTVTITPSSAGDFSIQINNLESSTIYYYRALAMKDSLIYGDELSFTTMAITTGDLNGHTWIDLGLPSGIRWATTNIGATNPEDYGNYYAWGETETKDTFNYNTYRYFYNGNDSSITKYCNNAELGYEGYTDDLTTLDSSDDAATVNWESTWRIPTQEEFQELIDNCTWSWTEQNNNSGYSITGPNGNNIFLPAGGFMTGTTLGRPNENGSYWTNSINSENPLSAMYLDSWSTRFSISSLGRSSGNTIRPVCPSAK